MVRVQDLNDPAPTFDLRIAAAHRGRGYGAGALWALARFGGRSTRTTSSGSKLPPARTTSPCDAPSERSGSSRKPTSAAAGPRATAVCSTRSATPCCARTGARRHHDPRGLERRSRWLLRASRGVLHGRFSYSGSTASAILHSSVGCGASSWAGTTTRGLDTAGPPIRGFLGLAHRCREAARSGHCRVRGATARGVVDQQLNGTARRQAARCGSCRQTGGGSCDDPLQRPPWNQHPMARRRVAPGG